jgi:hypothetical protein
MNAALRRYLVERRDRLVAKLQAKVDEQLAKLEARRQAAQQELLAKLGEDRQVVAQIASLLAGQQGLSGVSIPQLGKVLPLDTLQR